jgi:hypothetical protein
MTLTAFLREYTPALEMATVLLIAVLGTVTHHAFSKYMMARYGENVPEWSFGGNRVEAFIVTMRMLFSREPGAPAYFKLLLFFYRILCIALLLESAELLVQFLQGPA